MKRSAGIALVAISVFFLPVLAAGPKLGLKVSTHSGKAPLDLQLHGTLTGIEPGKVADCRVRIDRSYRTPAGQKLEERQWLPCVEPAGPLTASGFSRQILLEEPGDYALRLVVTPVEGREMAGVVQDVKVYHTIEAGVKGSQRRGD
jgi:hypothetical protein